MPLSNSPKPTNEIKQHKWIYSFFIIYSWTEWISIFSLDIWGRKHHVSKVHILMTDTESKSWLVLLYRRLATNALISGPHFIMTCRTRVKFIAMMTKEGSNKIANFMSLCKGVTMTLKLLLQWICIFYSTLIAIILRDYNAAFLCHCWFLLYPTQRVAEGIMFLTRLSYFYSQRNSSETA